MIHDQLLRGYLQKKMKTIFKDFYFETFLITKRLNLKEILLARVMEFSDENHLYLAAVLVEKKTNYSRILTSMDGNILATNQMSNAIIEINSLNKNACIYNYMPQLFWNYFKFDTFEEKNELEHVSEDYYDSDVFILNIE